MTNDTATLASLTDYLTERFFVVDNAWGGVDAHIDDDRTLRTSRDDVTVTLRMFVGGRAMLLSQTADMTNVPAAAVVALAEALTRVSADMIEAVCVRCGETFIPADADDLTHVETAAGDECDGRGVIAG